MIDALSAGLALTHHRPRIDAQARHGRSLGLGLPDDAFWSPWRNLSSSGKSVTVPAAMQLAAVWSCVRLLSETASTLPLKVYRRLPDGSRQTASDHPLHRLLSQQPNTEMTPHRFMLFIVASICLRGNAYVEKRRIAPHPRVVALHPLLPQQMKVERCSESGLLNYIYIEQGIERTIEARNMMHIRGFGLDGVCGIEPVVVGQDVIGAALCAEEAAAKVFAHGMQASGFLQHKAGVLNQAQRTQLRTEMNRFMGSKNAGKLMILEAGLEYQGISMNPEAAQMLQTRAMNIEQICSWFKVPPFMIGHMDKQSSWASSIEKLNLHFLTHSLSPLLTNIEQEISRCLIEPHERDEIYAEFSVEGLLRADSAARAAYQSIAVQNGWMNRNTVARLENLPQIPNGDLYTVQANLVPLDRLSQAASHVTSHAASPPP